jgi:hypothetical protein
MEAISKKSAQAPSILRTRAQVCWVPIQSFRIVRKGYGSVRAVNSRSGAGTTRGGHPGSVVEFRHSRKKVLVTVAGPAAPLSGST